MPNTYSWTFQSLDVHPSEAGLTNVVKKVLGHYIADDGLGHTAPQMIKTTLGPPDPENFVPFEDLTLEIVQGWVEAVMGETTLNYWKVELDARIYDDVETPEIAPPWI